VNLISFLSGPVTPCASSKSRRTRTRNRSPPRGYGAAGPPRRKMAVLLRPQLRSSRSARAIDVRPTSMKLALLHTRIVANRSMTRGDAKTMTMCPPAAMRDRLALTTASSPVEGDRRIVEDYRIRGVVDQGAGAIAMRCFWPPDKFGEPSST